MLLGFNPDEAQGYDQGLPELPPTALQINAMMLGSHLLGPLFMEYEGAARSLERELRLRC